MTGPLPPEDAQTRVVAPGAAPAPPGPPIDPEPEPSRGLGWGMLLALLVLVALAAAGAAVYFATRDDREAAPTTTAPLTTRPTTTQASNRVFVPDVVGLKQDAATDRLAEAELIPVLQYKPTKKPTGLVVAQKPTAAKRVEKGTKIDVVVDRGAPTLAVPDVTGLKVADAAAKLEAAKLKAQTTQVTTGDAPAGSVVSQAPAAGEKVDPGTVITLSVAKAPAQPGTTAAATTTAPAQTTAPATTAPATTRPTTTAPAPQPTSVAVPDLAGTDVKGASQALSQANLLASIQYVPSEEPLGTVVAQSPAAGSQARARSRVTINAAIGPGQKQQASVPNTVGQTLDQAVSTLNSAGLRLIFVKVPVTTRASVGKVVEQTPAAGSSAPRNAQVLVYLGVLR